MAIPHRDVPHRPTVIGKASSASTMLRLYWMLAGNFFLLWIASAILQEDSASLSWRDLAYGAVVLSLIAARYADVARFDGSKADGTPATGADLRRYVFRLSLISALAWFAIHGVPLF